MRGLVKLRRLSRRFYSRQLRGQLQSRHVWFDKDAPWEDLEWEHNEPGFPKVDDLLGLERYLDKMYAKPSQLITIAFEVEPFVPDLCKIWCRADDQSYHYRFKPPELDPQILIAA